MREFLDILQFVIDMFFRPSQNVYRFLAEHIAHKEYIFGGLALFGMFLLLVGFLYSILRNANPIYGFLLFLVAIILIGYVWFPGDFLITDFDVWGRFLKDAFWVFIGLGFFLSKISISLGALKIARWGADHFLSCMGLIAISYVIVALISLITEIGLLASFVLLVLLCFEVFRLIKEFGINGFVAIGLALLGGVGGIFEAALGQIPLNAAFERVVISFRYILPFAFIIGMAFFMIVKKSTKGRRYSSNSTVSPR